MRSEAFPRLDTLDGSGHPGWRLWVKTLMSRIQEDHGSDYYAYRGDYAFLLEFKNLVIPTINFVANMGLASGFTTMLGTWRGIFQYLFSCYVLPKNDFIGTAAWVFMVMNLFKLPFQVFTGII